MTVSADSAAPPIVPESEDELRDVVADALSSATRLEIAGNRTKARIGHRVEADRLLSTAGLTGITLYEPEELVLTARAGTLLSDIEQRLRQHSQSLAFEPPDWGPLLGGDAGRATIGGIVACNMAGPRRLKSGAARDHFLGVRAVSGRGEVFKSGGRVVKNVTGYDMCKLMAGSYGTLGVMTEITVKVLPAAEKTRTVLVMGLDDAAATGAMTMALQSPHDISAAAHLPSGLTAGSAVSYVREATQSVTALRIEGPEPSVLARCEALRILLKPFGALEELHGHNSNTFWKEIGDVRPFVEDAEAALWRLSVAPSEGAKIVAAIRENADASAYYDWGGGLVWLALRGAADAGQGVVRGAIPPRGGHAALMRASDAQRDRLDLFHPQDNGVAALSRRVRGGFDPNGILNPGRMYRES